MFQNLLSEIMFTWPEIMEEIHRNVRRFYGCHIYRTMKYKLRRV
jgi:hypothetical protein